MRADLTLETRTMPEPTAPLARATQAASELAAELAAERRIMRLSTQRNPFVPSRVRSRRSIVQSTSLLTGVRHPSNVALTRSDGKPISLDAGFPAAACPVREGSRMRLALVSLAALLLASLAEPAGGQRRSATLVGWIKDSTGAPIDRADVEIESMHALTRSDSAGAFKLRALDPGGVTVHVRRLGFDPQSFDFTLHASAEDSVAVTMRLNPRLLEAMRTDASIERRYTALEEFYRRRARAGGSGYFLTREEIERHHTNVLSDALREMPGLRVVRGHGTRSGVRFDSSNSKRLDCPPQYWIDGRRVNNTEIDDYPASDVEAIELYAGPSSTPMQFSQSVSSYTCGTVVIWTRIPGVPN
jgi:hypothetical protein